MKILYRPIQDVMNRDNPYALAFNHMSKVEEVEHLIAALVRMYNMRVDSDRRRYNMPHHEEVAAVFIGEDDAPPVARDIVVYTQTPSIGNNFHNITKHGFNDLSYLFSKR